MKFNFKIFALVFGAWLVLFTILAKYHIQEQKNDNRYDSIGINLENAVTQNIDEQKNFSSDTGFKKNLQTTLSITPQVNGGFASLNDINKYMVDNSSSQETLNNSLDGKSLVFQSVKIDDNYKVNMVAVPFTIINVKSDQYYPDEHKIIKKGVVGINKYTYINKLLRGEIVKSSQPQIQFLGTKHYVEIPDLNVNESYDYKKQIESINLGVKEYVVNPNSKDKYKKVFVGYQNPSQLSTLKFNEVVGVKVKWLTKKQYNKIYQKNAKQRKEEKLFKKWKKFTLKKLYQFKFLDENDRIPLLNTLSSAETSSQIKALYHKAFKLNNKKAARNGVGTGHFIPPVSPATQTSGVSFHLSNEGVKAVDFSPPGSYPGSHKITAADSGVVVFASVDGPYGNCVIIDHKNGYLSRYGHLNSFSVNVGDVVAQGDQLGWIGTTGNSTGTHVHFEIMKGNKNNTLNPNDFGIGTY